MESNSNRIGIDIEDHIFDVNGYEHLYKIHGGPGGGAYNAWWRRFFTPAAPYGPRTPENALNWLKVHETNGFIIK
jgi:hypothetical protein